MSNFKGFVYGGPVPGSAGFYFGQGSGGPGICSGDSPALVHVNFVNSRFYTRTSGQVGITSNDFTDLLTFTGPAGRTYTNADGDLVTVGLNEPRIGNHIDTGAGLFNGGMQMEAGAAKNVALWSADLSNAAWVIGAQATVTASGDTARVQFSGLGNVGTQIFQQLISATGEESQTHTIQMQVRSYNGGVDQGFRLKCTHQNVADFFSPDLIATSEWQDFSFSPTFGASMGAGFVSGVVSASTDEASDIEVRYVMQQQNAAVPTSYIPTSGAPVTRSPETLQPNPVELARALGSPVAAPIVNPDFENGSGWTLLGAATIADGVGTTANGGGWRQVGLGITPGTYLLQYDVPRYVGGSVTPFVGSTGSGVARSAVGSYAELISASGTDVFQISTGGGSDLDIDNVRLWRVTMPAAVSAAMDTFITYADLDTADQLTLYDHRVDANNRMTVTVSTDGANTGLFTFTMVNGGVSASVSAPIETTAGTNVAANVAWYADAAGINIAVNGTAATEFATAIGVPDLLTSDADLATGFNGNIRGVSNMAANIEVTGIEAATTGSGFNPLCPFDG